MEQYDDLYKIRHSLAHVMAMAVLRHWPTAKLAIGPVIENGFYYDFELPEKPSTQDLAKLEKDMKKILQKDFDFKAEKISLEAAKKMFAEQPYKLELIDELAKQGETEVSVYTSDDFTDLCRGPHVASSAQLRKAAFKVNNLAGAYWRGDEKNMMLTRFYGLAFLADEQLQAHLTMLQEAQKRDHRKLGKDLDLFTFSDLVGAGLALWTPKGTILRNLLDDYVWQLRQERGYQKVEIPHITKKDLYEVSGHWQKFTDELFKIKTREDHDFAMKPMNCPHHTQIFARKPHSYRDMPQRYANTTMVYRDEQTGELSGLSRVRCITQDDAHVFCRASQVKDEFLKVWDIVDTFYAAVGFDKLSVELSLHDPDNFDKYLGTPADWQRAEGQIRELATERGVQFTEHLGEAAFYGPKVDFIAKDSLGRTWQVATIQLDINLPERFDLNCTNEQGQDERIVMIHAAIMGSIERFLSILIEHHAGVFPLWLAPVQIKVLAVGERHFDFVKDLGQKFIQAGLRVELDLSDETVGSKIRKAETQKVPYMLVVGDKEMANDKLAVRQRGIEELLEISLSDFIADLQNKVEKKTA